MIKNFLRFCFFVLILSCSEKDSLGEKTVISGSLKDSDIASLILTDHSYDFQEEVITPKIIKVKNSQFSDTLEIPKGFYTLKYNKEQIDLFLKPGYQIQINLDNDKVSFTGKGGIENNYLVAKNDLERRIQGKVLYPSYSQLNEQEFLKFADSIKNLRTSLVKRYQELDAELKYLEKASAEIERAHHLIKYPFTRTFVVRDYNPSSLYPKSPLKEININDENLLNIRFYPMLMDLYAQDQAIKSNGEFSQWEFILSNNFPVKNHKIKEHILYTYASLSLSKVDKLDEFYKKFMSVVKNKSFKSRISKEYLSLKNLNTGAIAPEIKMTDFNNEIWTSKDFYGKNLFIDVWATWCGPCIKEMPALKNIQDEFKGKQIEFISVCIESRKQEAEEILKKFNIGGVNLFDKTGEENFKENFAINALPRYILINKEGQIEELVTSKPSSSALRKKLNALVQ